MSGHCKAKRYPFEASLPETLEVSGVILADQIKSLDWRTRNAKYACKAPAEIVADMIAKIQTLIS